MNAPGEKREQEEQAVAAAAARDVPYFDTRNLEAIESLKPPLTQQLLRQYHVAPLHQYNEKSLELGLTQQTDRARLAELAKALPGVQVTFKTISGSGFSKIINTIYYESFKAEREGDFESFGRRLSTAQPKAAFELIAQLAAWLGASDIHIEPQADTARIRFRLDGTLHPITNVNAEAYKVFLSDLQTKASIKWGSDKPQSGRISFNLMDNNTQIKSINMRIETIPAFHGEEIVVRLFNTEPRNLHLETMGFNAKQFKQIIEVTTHPNGMVLTVGPTGSGKTSTLYAILNYLNNPEVKIITLEDPVEYDLSGITQIQVKSDDKELFAQKLRAVLREDPNVIMIGEIRDVDTAKTALQAALTGHLVLSTFHGANAAAAIARMLDMIGQNPLFASAIRMIVAQRLARRICTHCIEEYTPPAEELSFLENAVAKIPAERQPKLAKPLKLKRGKGCPECHGLGYKGRIAIIEILPITPDIERLMTTVSKTTAGDIETQAVKNGMVSLLEDGIAKVLAEITTLEEIMKLQT